MGNLLEGKNAVIYGGAGAIGSAVASAFAREGAHGRLASRCRARDDRAHVVLGRPPRLADVTSAATFLASDQASGITGSIVNATAGLVLR